MTCQASKIVETSTGTVNITCELPLGHPENVHRNGYIRFKS